MFPIIVVLVVLAIKNRNDSAPVDSSAAGGAQNNTVISADLSAVPEELRSNFFLKQKEAGCCKTLSGNVAVAVVMVDDSVCQWNSEAKAELQTTLQTNGEKVVADAAAYQTDLSLSFHYYTAQVAGDVGGDDKEQWYEEALKSAGLPAMSEMHDYLTKKHSAKEAPVMFVLNKSGRASASTGQSESIIMFHKSGYDGFQHELLHVFGAKDYYYPSEVKQWAMERFPNSIMNSGGNEVDSFSAYLVGWTDAVADNAIAFLSDSSGITAEYMLEENEKELFTGTGTRVYENGTYTGGLMRGFRHGTGTMQYDNGGWYTGQWDNGQKAGTGTGKLVYENGSVYEGGFLDGKCHGKGKLVYESGSVYDGDFQNGELHGQGTYTTPNGSVYIGGWSESKKSGKGTGKDVYDNGYYEGEFYNGQRHGQGTYVWENGDRYTGQWNDGKRTGYGTYTWASGSSKTGQWNDGEFVG